MAKSAGEEIEFLTSCQLLQSVVETDFGPSVCPRLQLVFSAAYHIWATSAIQAGYAGRNELLNVNIVLHLMRKLPSFSVSATE